MQQCRRLLAALPAGHVIDRILDQWCELAAIRSPKRKLTRPKRRNMYGSTWARHHSIKAALGSFIPGPTASCMSCPRLSSTKSASIGTGIKSPVRNRRDWRACPSGLWGYQPATPSLAPSPWKGRAARLKLADFDHLDLSNLNRLQAGVHELGLNKAVLAARQIFELNPFADITVYAEALSDANLDEFLLGHPALDLVIEECDSLDIKVRVRQRARELRLPVLMQTSDRGMVDVERFDLEPDRPLFHGLAGELDASRLKGLTTEDKVAPVLDIIGVNTMSARIAASLVEIDRTIKIWPQLGSEVLLGGATITTAVRQFGLGRGLPSGRRYVDLESVLETAPIPPRQGDMEASPALAPVLEQN